jgi:hypothetical protein
MKKVIFSVSFIYLCILSGCATLRVDYNGPDKGIVILTLTGNKEDPITDYCLRIRKKDKSASGGVFYIPHNIFRQTPCDFEERYYHGFVKVLKLEPGEYEVFNFLLGRGGSGIFYTAKKDFSAPFTVKEGEIIYIGEYWFASIRTKSFMGTSYTFYVTLSDRGGRDIPIAIKKEPTIRDDWIKVQIPVGERFGN